MEQLSMRAHQGMVSLTSSQGSMQARDFEQYVNNSRSDSGILSGASLPDPHLQQPLMNQIIGFGRIEEMNQELEESKGNFELISNSNVRLQKMAKMIRESKMDVENVHSGPLGTEHRDDGSEEQVKLIRNLSGRRSSLLVNSHGRSSHNSLPRGSESISDYSNRLR